MNFDRTKSNIWSRNLFKLTGVNRNLLKLQGW